MLKIKYNDFDVEGVADEGGHAFILRGTYTPTGMLSAIKVYKHNAEVLRKGETESLEKLAETLYVPEPIGIGSTPPYPVNVVVLSEKYFTDCPSITFYKSQPFLAKGWVEGYEIFHRVPELLKPSDPQPFREEGRSIIHQYLDFIEKSSAKGIYLSDLGDALWVPEKRRISFIDVGSRIESFNYMIAHCIELILEEARIQLPRMGRVTPSLAAANGLHVDDSGLKEVSVFVDKFNSGVYRNRLDALERDLIRLLDEAGYQFQPLLRQYAVSA